MKCPNCGYNSFDYLDACKKCGGALEADPRYKFIYGPLVEEYSGKEDVNLPESRNSEEEAPEVIFYTSSVPDPGFQESSELTKEADDFSQSGFLPSSHYSLPRDTTAFSEAEEPTEYHLAGIGSRAGAILFDLIILMGITALSLWLGFYTGNITFNINNNNLLILIAPLYLILFSLSTTYFLFLHAFSGKTIGKMIFGIKVIRKDGQPIGLWEALIRWLGYLISGFFIFIGFIWAIFDSRRQAWHDKLAETYVVKD
jgi:uncharacterized RDD family membrane protein YckC